MKRVLNRIRPGSLVRGTSFEKGIFRKFFEVVLSLCLDANNCEEETNEEKPVPFYVTFSLSFSFSFAISFYILSFTSHGAYSEFSSCFVLIYISRRIDDTTRYDATRRPRSFHRVPRKEEILQERQTPSGVCKYNRFEGCACTSPGVFSTRQT